MISSRIPMRRFENGTHDPKMISAILDEISIVHVGCFDEEYPYVVPLSFGYEIKDDRLLVYVHGAREGHKIDLWKKNPHVALTFSMFYNHPDRLYKGCMHDFRSVMALGTIAPVDRKAQPRLNGKAVQTLLKQNARRPNQFSMSHYMWMGIYVVTCDMENVVGKFENPIEDPAEVPFPDVYSIPENNVPYDCEYFYHKKQYGARQNEWTGGKAAAVELGDDSEIELPGGDIELRADWSIKQGYEDKDIDMDLSALLLDSEGRVPRRYDMVFYNQPADRSKTVTHCGDDILSEHRGSEALRIRGTGLPDYLSEIVISLSSFGADKSGYGLEVLDSLELTITDCGSGAAAGRFSLDVSGLLGEASSLAVLKRSKSGWIFRKSVKSLGSWRILDQSRIYGLAKWKE